MSIKDFKEKISDIWFDIEYYTKYEPIHIYKVIRHWWHCNATNPYHWKLVWYCMFHHYGWDNNYTLQVLQLTLKKSRRYFETHKYISDAHINHTIKWQTIAINLLDILINDYELWDFNNMEYHCLVKVNTKNMDRFTQRLINYETGEVIVSTKEFEREPHTLYMEKARKLVYKILDMYSPLWYD